MGAWRLAIPVGPALSPRGIPRRPGPRDWQNLSYRRSRRGNELLVHPTLGIIYVLKEEVTIKARHFLRDGTRAPFNRFPARVGKAVQRAAETLGAL